MDKKPLEPDEVNGFNILNPREAKGEIYMLTEYGTIEIISKDNND